MRAACSIKTLVLLPVHRPNMLTTGTVSAIIEGIVTHADWFFAGGQSSLLLLILHFLAEVLFKIQLQCSLEKLDSQNPSLIAFTFRHDFFPPQWNSCELKIKSTQLIAPTFTCSCQ